MTQDLHLCEAARATIKSQPNLLRILTELGALPSSSVWTVHIQLVSGITRILTGAVDNMKPMRDIDRIETDREQLAVRLTCKCLECFSTSMIDNAH